MPADVPKPDPELRRHLVRLIRAGRPLEELAKEFGLSLDSFRGGALDFGDRGLASAPEWAACDDSDAAQWVRDE
jgi:hypothetical protein